MKEDDETESIYLSRRIESPPQTATAHSRTGEQPTTTLCQRPNLRKSEPGLRLTARVRTNCREIVLFPGRVLTINVLYKKNTMKKRVEGLLENNILAHKTTGKWED